MIKKQTYTTGHLMPLHKKLLQKRKYYQFIRLSAKIKKSLECLFFGKIVNGTEHTRTTCPFRYDYSRGSNTKPIRIPNPFEIVHVIVLISNCSVFKHSKPLSSLCTNRPFKNRTFHASLGRFI